MFLPRLAALVALLLCLAALPATAQDSPNLDGLRLLAEDLKIASNLAYTQARATAPTSPATTKLGSFAAEAARFYNSVPGLMSQPDRLQTGFGSLETRFNAMRAVVDNDAPAPVVLTFEWVEMLMVKMGMYFGQNLSQSDFPPGAAIPPGEGLYTIDGLGALAQQVYVLSNQLYILTSQGTLSPARAQAADQWLSVTNAARSLREGVNGNLSQVQLLQRFQTLSIAWQKAVPLFGNLEPSFTQKQDFAMLLSNYVRLRAAYGQLYSGIMWGDPAAGSVGN